MSNTSRRKQMFLFFFPFNWLSQIFAPLFWYAKVFVSHQFSDCSSFIFPFPNAIIAFKNGNLPTRYHKCVNLLQNDIYWRWSKVNMRTQSTVLRLTLISKILCYWPKLRVCSHCGQLSKIGFYITFSSFFVSFGKTFSGFFKSVYSDVIQTHNRHSKQM